MIAKEIRKRVYDKYNGGCAYCGQFLLYKEMQIDHMIPKSQANEHNYKDIHSLDNLMPSCRSCNHYKRSYGLEAFRKAMLTLHERIEKIYICRVAINYDIIQIRPFDGRFYFEIPEQERQLPF